VKLLVSLQLYSRGEAKQYLEKLFEQISNREYRNAQITANSLKTCLLKYYLTRGVECDNISETFHEFDYLLRNCRGSTKKDTLFNYIIKIRQISHLAMSDPVDRLRQLYEDLRYAYLHMSKENVETILDCFDEIRDLSPRMKEVGGSINNYYNLALRSIGDCEGILVDVTTFQGKIPDKSTIKGLTSNFQKLFSMIQSVFAPPIMLELTPEEVQKHIRKGHSLEELSKASGHRQEELQAMLTSIEMAGAEQDEN